MRHDSGKTFRRPPRRGKGKTYRLDHAFGSMRPRIGFVATGKAYRDLRQALALIGIDEAAASALGIAIYKVGMSWPLEPIGIASFARGLETQEGLASALLFAACRAPMPAKEREWREGRQQAIDQALSQAPYS